MPDCLKQLLTVTGYNSIIALRSLNEENIKELEDYILCNCKELVNDLKEDCSGFQVYQQQMKEQRFEFLPGHKVLLMEMKRALPDKAIRTKVYGTRSNSASTGSTQKQTIL